MTEIRRYHRHHHPGDNLEVRQLLETEEHINALWARVEGVINGNVEIQARAFGGGGGGASAFVLPAHQHPGEDITSGVVGTQFGGTGANLFAQGPGFLYLADLGVPVSVIGWAEASAYALRPIWEPYADEPFALSHYVRQCSGNATSDYTHYSLNDSLHPIVDVYNPFNPDPDVPAATYNLVTGIGTTNTVPRWTDALGTLGDSTITDDGTTVSLTAGILSVKKGTQPTMTTDYAKLWVDSDLYLRYRQNKSDMSSPVAAYVLHTNEATSPMQMPVANQHLRATGSGWTMGLARTSDDDNTFWFTGNGSGMVAALYETTAPSATANYTKIYSLASDHHLYYTDASGNHGKIWTSYNDGAGSGLDADTVDGSHASAFMAVPAGTLNTIAKFTGTGTTIGNSILSDDGTTATVTGNLTYTGRLNSTQTLPSLAAHRNELAYTGTEYSGDCVALAVTMNNTQFFSNTGTGSDISLNYARTAFKVTLGSATNIGRVRLRIKKSASTADTAYVRVYTWTDDGGSPSKPSAADTTGALVYAYNLSTSYTALDLQLNDSSVGSTFWIALYPSAYASNPFIVDGITGGSDLVANWDGAAWNLTTGTIYAYAYTGSPMSLGCYTYSATAGYFRNYGSSYAINCSSAYGSGLAGTGVVYGVYGTTTGPSTTGCAGVYGGGTAGVGVFGTSTSYYGIYGTTATGCAGRFGQSGSLTKSTSDPCLYVRRANTLGAYTSSGSLVYIEDVTASTGKLIEAQKYSAALASTNVVWYLTHGNDGRTITERLYGYDTTAGAWRYWDWSTTTASTFTLSYNGTTHATFDGANRTLTYDGGAIFNESGADYDFRIEGDTDTLLFNLDAGLDRIGIGCVPTSKLDVNGDIECVSTGAFYWGDPITDGTWKCVRDGDDLVFYRRESGSYVEKSRLSA
jgi:hypothetical protein